MARERPYFSDANDLRRPITGLVRDNIPPRVRNAVERHIQSWPEVKASYAWAWILNELDWEPALLSHHYEESRRVLLNTREFRAAIQSRDYPDILDLLTALYRYLVAAKDVPASNVYRELLNDRLVRHYSAYLMAADGRLEEQGSKAAEQVVSAARDLLTDPRMAGPDRQFQDAVLAFHRRPDPNFETTVSSAINAVEGVARIALANESITLGAAVKQIATSRGLHTALADSIAKLYGYASDEAGRHGLTGDPKVDLPIAEFCLHQAAAAIVFIARLYGFDVVEGSVAR